MTHAAITGWGKCLPPAVLTNEVFPIRFTVVSRRMVSGQVPGRR